MMKFSRSAPLMAALLTLPQMAVADEIPFKDLENVAIAALTSIQPQSVEAQIEYCGYVVWENDALSTTPIAEGGLDYCDLPTPKAGQQVIASFHTHGNHDVEYHSEVPSDSDVEGDFEEEIYGFVGTPGGRVWLIDPYQEEIFLICGEACIPQDANYDARDYPNLPEVFSPDSLLEFLES